MTEQPDTQHLSDYEDQENQADQEDQEDQEDRVASDCAYDSTSDAIDQSQQTRQYEPLPLLPNIQYPTYQLYAVAGQGGTPSETVLTIAVLETMQWLRKRFREIDLPSELDWPESSCYDQVDSSEFTSFSINEGYKVEVIWLPEEGIWTLQLVEPDLGPQPGAESQGRAPVPGRSFETNVGYRIVESTVECGFCTIVSEPVGTEQECEVYRLALIKHLARNPLVGLRQGGWALQDEVHMIDTMGAVKKLEEWLNNSQRMMPAVVFAEHDAKGKFSIPAIANLTKKDAPPSQLPDLNEIGITESEKKGLLQTLLPGQVQQEEKSKLPFDITELTRYKMGYGQFFVLPTAQMEAFRKEIEQPVRPGDILIFNPKAFGGESHFYPLQYTKQNPEQIYRKIEDYIQNYPKNKPMTFGNVAFLAKAKEIESEKILNNNQSKEELLYGFEEKLQAIMEKQEEELRKKGEEYYIREEQLRRKLSSGTDRVRELEKKNQDLRILMEIIEQEHAEQLADKDKEIQRMFSLLKRPERPCEVADWVEAHFAGRLIFHQRAAEAMDKVDPNQVNMDLTCDALEFLAMEYRDLLAGVINEEEMNNRCYQKYNRPFDVIHATGVTVNMYPGDYKIKYYVGHRGRPVESLLDYHLRVGKDTEKHLRIYFLYDSDKKLIVVGYLPRHLPTVTFK